MLNNLVLVGRLTADPDPIILEDGRKVLNVNLAVQRPFKNHNGDYDTDFIKVSLWEGLATAVEAYCKKGIMVAIKGRLQTRKFQIEDKSFQTIEVIGERLTYLANKD